MDESTKKVFISYSWAVQERVIELAERLIANGVDVVLDVYDLNDGDDKYAFMERSVNDPTIDNVLVICDKTYTDKANNRTGGVGDETVIITPEIYNHVKQSKFIPVIFEKDEEGRAYCPHFIKSRIYIDLSSDNQYEAEYEKLLRDIFKKPLYKKPALGKKPEWLEEDHVDLSAIRDTIKQVKGYNGQNQRKADFLLRKAADDFVEAAKEYTLSNDKPRDEALLVAIDQEKELRNLCLDYVDALIYSNLPLAETLVNLFERLYNELHNAEGQSSYRDSDFEFADFIIWELFIDITAILLHYKCFSELHNLLVRPYFLRKFYSTTEIEANSYCVFRKFSQTIEEVCKPKSSTPNLFTLAGDMIVKREKKPILTEESISNADIVLYQLASLLSIPQSEKSWQDEWFPTTYVYHSGFQSIWKRMKSKTYCEEIGPLFGVKTVDEIKNVVKNSVEDENMRYNRSFERAPGILSSISLDEIGTLE